MKPKPEGGPANSDNQAASNVIGLDSLGTKDQHDPAGANLIVGGQKKPKGRPKGSINKKSAISKSALVSGADDSGLQQAVVNDPVEKTDENSDRLIQELQQENSNILNAQTEMPKPGKGKPKIVKVAKVKPIRPTEVSLALETIQEQ